MKNIEKKLKLLFDKEDGVREKTLRLTREVGRMAADSIKKIHQRNFPGAEKEIKEALDILKNAKKILKECPEIYYAGFLHAAEKELAEAVVTFNIIKNGKIPEPDKYGFDYKSYLHGMCESNGELRRYMLDEIRKGEIEKCEKMLDMMDDIYYFLLNFQYADAITRSLRRQVDYVRSMLERARSEVTLAKINMR
ncbi:MAG TPA: translin family protein [bacterium]|nr:translin family protein [bacterium]